MTLPATPTHPNLMPNTISQTVRKAIQDAIQSYREKISDVNKTIYKNPELAFKEFKAHAAICDLFDELKSDLKATVERTVYDLPTSFQITAGNGGRLVVINAEYDALPTIGHACGHNLIATSAVSAFIGAAKALSQSNQPGRVRLLGTPAEELGGGKLKLIAAGAYKDVDACIMVHPFSTFVDTAGKPLPDLLAISKTVTLASQKVDVQYAGEATHAGIKPWNGKNALDALINAHTSISALRQQLKPTIRVAGIVKKGGTAANIIPDDTSAEYVLRAVDKADLDDLRQKTIACFQAGAAAAGCTVNYTTQDPHLDLHADSALCERYTAEMLALGYETLNELAGLSDVPVGSTDQGNVTYVCPAIMPVFSLDTTALNHTAAFSSAAGTPDAFARAVKCGEGLACLAFAVLSDDNLAKAAKNTWKGLLHKI